MKISTITDRNDACIDGAKHELVPARQRGSKVRFRCNVCTRMTGWEKQEGTVVEKEPVSTHSNRADDLDSHTLAELKSILKKRGVIGYSKMNKAALIDAVTDTDNLVNV